LKDEEDEEADGAGKLNSNGPFFSTSRTLLPPYYPKIRKPKITRRYGRKKFISVRKVKYFPLVYYITIARGFGTGEITS